MATKKQLKILEVFAKKPFAEYTRKEIKKESKEKSNNALALAINSLKKEGVLIEKKIGKSGLLALNLDHDVTFYYLALCNHFRIPHLADISLEILKKETELDIAIFIENEDQKKKIEILANSAGLKSALEMDIHVIPKAEMLEMLANKEENLGKQIVRKHLAIYNQDRK